MKHKRFGIVFALIFGICFGFFVQKSFAVGSNLVISEVQTKNSLKSKQFVELYNDDSQPVDLNHFVLEYAKPGAQIDGGCMAATWQDSTKASNVKTYNLSDLTNPTIPPHGHLIVKDFSMNDNVGGSVRLAQTITSTVVYDLVGWGNKSSSAPCTEGKQAPIPGDNQSLERFFNNTGHPIDTDNNLADFVLSDTPTPGASSAPTPGKGAGIPCDNKVELSEFLTDPVGLEADGGEFVELYNPSNTDANLLGCHLKSSHSSSDLMKFSSTDTVPAQGYFVAQLTNKLTNKQGDISFETANQKEIVNYSNIGEGQADALVNGKWLVTDQPTPKATNKIVALTDKQVKQAKFAPCPSGKFRNPATNRCKNIKSKESSLKPCNADQYRNSATNRCKKIASVTTTLKPCAADQTRNPATNRCKKIASASTKLTPCKTGYTRNKQTHRCRKNKSGSSFTANLSQPASINPSKTSPTVALIVGGLALGYGVYEYRQEIWRGWRHVCGLVFKPPDSS